MTNKQIQVTTYLSTLIGILLLFYCFNQGYFSDPEKLQILLNKSGILAPILFIGLQIFQAVFPLIPGGLSTSLGVVAFGPIAGFIYNYIGAICGSILIFLLARRYGKPFILKFTKQETYDKYVRWLDKKNYESLFALAIFMPCAPDDLLCMIAGLTTMSLKKFSWIIILGKPLSLLAYSLGLLEVLKYIQTLF